MMDALHKIVTYFINPLTTSVIIVLVGLCLRQFAPVRIRRYAVLLIIFPFAWIYLWSLPVMSFWLGLSLEEAYPPIRVEALPAADMICILGGGMGANTNVCIYPEMTASADRVWHGARLYKAGKAPRISLSGGGVSYSTAPLLGDLGIPPAALTYFPTAKNTEDEARLIAEKEGAKRILLVTSAWHMRRAELLFRRAGLDVIPAATDYEFTMAYKDHALGWFDLLPRVDALGQNSYLMKEHFAYWCYKIFY